MIRHDLHCSHTLVKVEGVFPDRIFKIVLRSSPPDSKSFTPHALEIFMNGDHFTFENVNGTIKLLKKKEEVSMLSKISGIDVSRVGKDVRILIEDISLNIVWDTEVI